MRINFFRTLGIIRRHPYSNKCLGIFHHILWQFRKILNLFPCTIRFSRSLIIVPNRTVANGCGALINAMNLYDANNMRFLQDVFSRKLATIFFDVGSNIGSYSVLAAEHPGVDIYSFEPHPETTKYLQANADLNRYHSIHVHCIALSDKEGKVCLTNVPGSSVNRIVSDTESEGIEVKTATLSSICRRLEKYPEIMKIDTEGYDSAVINGCNADIFKNMKCLIIEDFRDTDSVFIKLRQHGFRGPYEVDFGKRKLSFSHSLKQPREDFLFLKEVFLCQLHNEAGFQICNASGMETGIESGRRIC